MIDEFYSKGGIAYSIFMTGLCIGLIVGVLLMAWSSH